MQHIMNIKSNEVKEDKEEENKTKEASIVKEENIKKIGKKHEKDVKKQRRVKNLIWKESQKTTLMTFGLLLRKPTEKKQGIQDKLR